MENRSIHEFNLWRDEHRETVVNALHQMYDEIIKCGARIGMRDEHIKSILQRKARVKSQRSFEHWNDFKFSLIRDKDDFWRDLTVEFRVEIEQEYQTGDIKAETTLRLDGNRVLPQEASQYGNMLVEIGILAAKIRSQLESVFDSLPDKVIDPAKKLADTTALNRRRFVNHEIDDGKVLVFVQDTLLPMFEDSDTLVHRFEGKERKLLNQVPDSVATVEHKRGGPSTITLTQGTLDHLEQKKTDEEKKAA